MEVVWKEVATKADERPDYPRSGHCSTALPAGCPHGDVLIFGGYTEYDAEEEGGREANCDTYVMKAGSWKKLEIDSPPPKPRIGAQAVTLNNKVYVIGGWNPGPDKDGGQTYKSVAVLDLETLKWEKVTIQGEKLQPISRFQAEVVGDHIYVHTHRCTENRRILRMTPCDSDEGPALHLESVKLEVDWSCGEEPESRFLHTVTAVDSTLWLFGGAPKTQGGDYLNDLWYLDLEADKLAWKKLKANGEVPSNRCSHTAAAVGTDIVFHGGTEIKVYEDGGYALVSLDDTFVLDTVKKQWKWPSQDYGPQPPARNAATLTCTAGNDLVLHGGWDPFQSEVTHNDTWVAPTPYSGHARFVRGSTRT